MRIVISGASSGIGEALVRISVGTEHWRDLLEDFTRALANP